MEKLLMHKWLVALWLICYMVIAIIWQSPRFAYERIYDKDICAFFIIVWPVWINYLSIYTWRRAASRYGVRIVSNAIPWRLIAVAGLVPVWVTTWGFMTAVRMAVGHFMHQPPTHAVLELYLIRAVLPSLFWLIAWDSMCWFEGDFVGYMRQKGYM